eukprot:m.124727 g.124727  ORF g.124727 m.124727 type:complete len:606 (-) comp15598_c4_seq3:443-2260(-)
MKEMKMNELGCGRKGMRRSPLAFSLACLMCAAYMSAAVAGEGDSSGGFDEKIRRLERASEESGISFGVLTGTHPAVEEPTEEDFHEMHQIPPLPINEEDWFLSNPMTVDARVIRGPSWKWGDVDGGPGSLGTVVGHGSAPTWWRVRWDNKHENTYRYGSGVYDLIIVKTSPLDGVTIFGSPARIPWTPDVTKPFAEQVARNDEPLVLLNTSASAWPALSLWTLDNLASRYGTMNLQRVKVTRRQAQGSTPFFYYHNAPMNSSDPQVKAYKEQAYTLTNMTLHELLVNITTPSSPGDPIAVYAGKLDDFGLDFFAHVMPLDPFMVLQPGFDPDNEHLFRQTHIWIGGRQTSTPVHFDLFHNFFVQIVGRKRILLFPPAQWQHLYLYPLLHPAGRSAQVNLDVPLYDQKHSFPLFHRNHTFALEVILEPVQVLYIPPLWFHHITSLEPSVSLSVWTPHLAIEVAAKAAEDIPLPIVVKWSSKEKIMALRIFFESIVESLRMGMNTAEFLHWTMLENRYKYIGNLTTTLGKGGPYCDDKIMTSRLLEEAGDAVFRAPLKAIVKIFKDVRELGGPDRLVIELANYFELATAAILPVNQVKQFFHDMIYC